MKGRELTIYEVRTLPHGTRIHVESVFSIQEHALINQESKRIGNRGNRGMDYCIVHFKDLEDEVSRNNYKFYEWKKDDKMKTCTTLEMMRLALEDTSKIFKTIAINGNAFKVQAVQHDYANVVEHISGDCNGESFEFNSVTSEYVWEEVIPYVDFMTAVNSGKRIKHKSWDYFMTMGYVIDELAKCDSYDIREMINSKEWYIEE